MTTTTNLMATPSAALVGNATVTTTRVIPAENVVSLNGGQVIGTVPVSAAGTAVPSLTTLSSEIHTFVSIYSDSAEAYASSSVPKQVSIHDCHLVRSSSAGAIVPIRDTYDYTAACEHHNTNAAWS